LIELTDPSGFGKKVKRKSLKTDAEIREYNLKIIGYSHEEIYTSDIEQFKYIKEYPELNVVSGDMNAHSKAAEFGTYYDAEDNKYGVHIWRNAKDTMDCDTAGRNVSRIYNSINAGIDNSNLVCDALCWTCSFVEYSMYCFNSNNCFGCVGMRKKNYCILNKQYEKEEYEEIVSKIKSELKDKGEYGQFFGKHLSCFGYNETPANEQFPLSKDEAIKQGSRWEDTERGTYNKETKKVDQMPESFSEIDFDVAKEVFICESCNKNYRVIPNEFLFYKKLNVPLPRLCPDCRHYRRMKSRGPNKLWYRSCMKEGCTNEFETSYAPYRPEIVYCEKCYQNEVI